MVDLTIQLGTELNDIRQRKAEVEERLRSLEGTRQIAEEIEGRQIPQRKFGSRVTKAQQQDVISQREQASQTLIQIKQEKESLTEQQQRLNALESQIGQQIEFERGRKIGQNAGSGAAITAEGLTKAEKAGFEQGFLEVRKGEADLALQKEIAEFEKETGNKVIITNGRIGIESPALMQSFATVQAYNARINELQNIQERQNVLNEFHDKVFGLAPKTTTPINFIEQTKIENLLSEIRGRTKENFGTEALKVGAGLLTGIISGTKGTIKGLIFFGKEVITEGPIVGLFNVGKSIGQAIDTNLLKGDVGKLIIEEPSFFAGNVAGQILVTKFTQEVFIKTPVIAENILSRTEILGKFFKVEQGEFRNLPASYIKNVEGIGDIGLIPPGKPNSFAGIPKSELPAFIRGGFGFSEEELNLFKGETGVATSQRGLISVFKREIEIKEIETGLGIFGTPRDPLTKLLQTRISRLGELPRSPSIFELATGEFKIGFSGKPQIITFLEEKVGQTGRFELGPKLPSTELEVATPAPRLGGPKVITEIEKIGVTNVGGIFSGRTVRIYKAILGESKGGTVKITTKVITESTEKLIPKISKTGLISNTLKIENSKLVRITEITNKINTRRIDISRITSLYRTTSYKRISLPKYKQSTPNYIKIRIPNYPGTRNNVYPRLPSNVLGSASRGPPTIRTPSFRFSNIDTSIPNLRKKEKRRKKLIFEEGLYYTPSLTAQALNIRINISLKKLTSLAKKGFTGFDIRAIPKIKI